jgi:hypothetical protein
VNGSADLEAPATATLLADPPAPTGNAKKSGKKAPAKDVKDSKDAKDKAKKGKKGKK